MSYIKSAKLRATNLSKTVLTSPGQRENVDGFSNSTEEVLNRVSFEGSVEINIVQEQRDAHQKRLKSLRKELDYLNSTAWKYQPIEKYIGQS